jgi:hypothetical protein
MNRLPIFALLGLAVQLVISLHMTRCLPRKAGSADLGVGQLRQ